MCIITFNISKQRLSFFPLKIELNQNSEKNVLCTISSLSSFKDIRKRDTS